MPMSESYWMIVANEALLRRAASKREKKRRPEPQKKESIEESMARVLSAVKFSNGLSVQELVDKLSLSTRRIRRCASKLEAEEKISSFRDGPVKIYTGVVI